MTLVSLYKCNLSAGEEMWLIQPLGSSTLTLAEKAAYAATGHILTALKQ